MASGGQRSGQERLKKLGKLCILQNMNSMLVPIHMLPYVESTGPRNSNLRSQFHIRKVAWFWYERCERLRLVSRLLEELRSWNLQQFPNFGHWQRWHFQIYDIWIIKGVSRRAWQPIIDCHTHLYQYLSFYRFYRFEICHSFLILEMNKDGIFKFTIFGW